MSQQEKITLLQFQERFNTEEACRGHLFQIRWPEGFICSRCGHTEYYNLPKRKQCKQYQCKGCRYQVSLTAGTIVRLNRWAKIGVLQKVFL